MGTASSRTVSGMPNSMRKVTINYWIRPIINDPQPSCQEPSTCDTGLEYCERCDWGLYDRSSRNSSFFIFIWINFIWHQKVFILLTVYDSSSLASKTMRSPAVCRCCGGQSGVDNISSAINILCAIFSGDPTTLILDLNLKLPFW